MQYSGKRPAQKSLLCEFRQKTAYKHIISSLRKVRHKELGPCLALLYLLLYVINESKTAYVTDKQLVICTPDVQPSAIKQRAFLLIIKCL